MATLFFSYSHKDEELRDQLEVHLSALRRQGIIETWHDRRITTGSDFKQTISHNLENADIILLLISADFIASDYCYDIEMKRALEKHVRGETVVIPVILRPCDWKDTPFGNIQAAPKDAKPIIKWPTIDDAFLDITQSIKNTVKQKCPQTTSNFLNFSTEYSHQQDTTIRSSNLRVAKQFTEHERDTFLYESFNYIATFFENSLEELSHRNSDINSKFRQIDSNRFTCTIYRNGQTVSRCSVFLSGIGNTVNQIAYSSSDNGHTSGFNESLSVETDEQSLFLKVNMNWMLKSNESNKLTKQGGAEFLWTMLMEPLQGRMHVN